MFKPKEAKYDSFCSRDCCFATKAEGRQATERCRALLREQTHSPRSCPMCEVVFEPKRMSQRLCGAKACIQKDSRQSSMKVYLAQKALLEPTVTKPCQQCSSLFTLERTRGCGRKTCPACAKENAKRSKRDRNNHKRRARRANVPYVPVSRKQVIATHGRKCWICKKDIPLKAATLAESFSLDHVVPLSLGGWHHPMNIRPAHHRCNSIKSNKYVGQLMLTVVSSVESVT